MARAPPVRSSDRHEDTDPAGMRSALSGRRESHPGGVCAGFDSQTSNWGDVLPVTPPLGFLPPDWIRTATFPALCVRARPWESNPPATLVPGSHSEDFGQHTPVLTSNHSTFRG